MILFFPKCQLYLRRLGLNCMKKNVKTATKPSLLYLLLNLPGPSPSIFLCTMQSLILSLYLWISSYSAPYSFYLALDFVLCMNEICHLTYCFNGIKLLLLCLWHQKVALTYSFCCLNYTIFSLSRKNDELRKDAVDALCCLAHALGEDFTIFVPSIHKLLQKHRLRVLFSFRHFYRHSC